MRSYSLQSQQRSNTHDPVLLALQNPAYAGAAAGILALEAGHAATIRGAVSRLLHVHYNLKL